jgi:hypothetical protein
LAISKQYADFLAKHWIIFPWISPVRLHHCQQHIPYAGILAWTASLRRYRDKLKKYQSMIILQTNTKES